MILCVADRSDNIHSRKRLATCLRSATHIAVRHVRAGMCRDTYPFSGKLFVFQSKRGDSVKIFYWHHNGFAVWSKRLQEGRFPFPRDGSGTTHMTRSALRMILEGVDLKSLRKRA